MFDIAPKGTIAVCTPMYGDMASRSYINTLLQLADTLRMNGYAMSFHSVGNESLITRARNILVHEALKIEDLAGVLFFDADQGADPNDVLSLIESGKDIIAGLVPTKSINWKNVKNAALLNKEDLSLYSGNFNVWFLDDRVEVSYVDPVEVRHIGTGLMYVSKKVFEEMGPVCKTYKNNVPNEEGDYERIVEYFSSYVDEESDMLLSEDYGFCEKWRKLGNSVWAAPWVRNIHMGSYLFSGSFSHSVDLLARLEELKKD